MAFSLKNWKNKGETPSTPISAASLTDLEKRVTDYSDTKAALEGGKLVESQLPNSVGRSLESFGDVSGDARATVQAALNSGSYFHTTPGASYTISGSLTVPVKAPGLYLSAGSQIIAAYKGSAGSNGSVFHNASYTEAISGFSVTGPGMITTPTPATNTHGIFSLWADDLLLDEFIVNGWGGAPLATLVGDRIRIGKINGINSALENGAGGIRYGGGTNFRCVGAHIDAGDSTFGLVATAPGSSSPLPKNVSITDALYIGCTGSSSVSNVCQVSLNGLSATEPDLSCSITDSGFVGIVGVGGTDGAVRIQNLGSSGEIDVFVNACSISAGLGPGALTAEQQSVFAGIGKMRVRTKNLKCRAVNINGNATNKIDYADIDAQCVGATATPCVQFRGCKASRFTGLVDMSAMPTSGTVYGIRIGEVATANADVFNAYVINIPNNPTASAIGFENCTRGSVRGGRIAKAEGATEGNGAVFVKTGASGIVLEDFDMTGVIGGITNQVAVTDTILRNVVGFTNALVEKTANYTTVAGVETVIATNNTFTVTLTGFYVGQTISVFNSGAGTITVAAGSGAIKGNASLAGANTHGLYRWNGTNWYQVG